MLKDGLRQKPLDLRDGILGNKYQIARTQLRGFAQAFFLQHLLQIENPRFHQIVVHMAEQKHLRMLRLVRKPARNLHRLNDARIGAQLVLAGPSYLSARHKIRMLKLFQRHRHLRIVQISRVRPTHRQSKLLQRQPLGEHRPAHLSKRHIRPVVW